MILSVLLTDDLVWELWLGSAGREDAAEPAEAAGRPNELQLRCILRSRSKAEVLRSLERLLDAWL